MKIKWEIDRNREVAAVIPTMDISSEMVQNIVKELDSLCVDSLLVENSGESFSFANSMNIGIEEILKRPSVKYVILSNDDVSEVVGLKEMIEMIEENEADYAQPFINGKSGAIIFTTSLFRAMINWGLRKKAPFYPIRIIKMIRQINKTKKFMISAPAILWNKGVVGVQPFALFRRKLIERFRFDEKIINGVEDDDLTYTLWKNHYRGITKREWNVNHLSNSSFKKINTRSKTGGFYGNDQHVGKNWAYFSAKQLENSGVMETK